MDEQQDAYIEYKKSTDFDIEIYTDASYSSEMIRHQHSGFIIRPAGNLINWASKRERRVCTSIHEAELRAIINGVEVGMWKRDLLVQTGFMKKDVKIMVYTDSQSVAKLMTGDSVIPFKTTSLQTRVDKIREVIRHHNVVYDHIMQAVTTTQMSLRSPCQATSYLSRAGGSCLDYTKTDMQDLMAEQGQHSI